MTGRMISGEEAKTLREKATPGPWLHGWSDDAHWVAFTSDIGEDNADQSRVVSSATAKPGAEHYDAALIAAAPDLAFTVEQQAKQIAAVLALAELDTRDLWRKPDSQIIRFAEERNGYSVVESYVKVSDVARALGVSS